MKKIFSLFLILCATAWPCFSQAITHATFGTAGGQLRNGDVVLNYTIGETFTGSQFTGTASLRNGFWNVVPASYKSSARTVFRFIGNGNFSDNTNWEGGIAPKSPLAANAEIIIAPAGDGQCIVNIPFSLLPGGKFSILAGKKCLIQGGLTIK